MTVRSSTPGARSVGERVQPRGLADRRIVQNPEAPPRRHELRQHLQPLCIKLGDQQTDAGDVAAGLGQARDQPGGDEVVGTGQDRDRARRRLRRARGRLTLRDDNARLVPDQRRRQLGKPRWIALGEAEIEADGAAIDIAERGQRLAKPPRR